MNQTAYDVLTCAAVIPAAGLDYNLFLKCIPNAEMVLAMPPLFKEGVLGLCGFKLVLKDNRGVVDSLQKHENPTVLLSFLENLLKEMKACSRIEENKEFVSVLHTFQNACERFCGQNIDDKLVELSVSLVNLLEEPFFHFLTVEMKCDRKEYLSILCNAEEALVLKVLDRAYEVSETSKQLTLFRFCLASLQAISHAHHNWLGFNDYDYTEHVDNLIGLIGERITKLEFIISLEEGLAELVRECGPLPDDDD